jgi:hypothetical protein
LEKKAPEVLQVPDITTAPVGVNPQCGIPRAVGGNLGNIANILTCGLSFFIVSLLIVRCSKRKAAVARVELRAMFTLYAASLIFQLLTSGSLLQQGTKALVVLTALHMGTIAAFFWYLLGNAIVATQVVEDGTMASLVPFHGMALLFFAATTYISLDVGFSFTNTIGVSNPPADLKSIPLFILVLIWPAAASLLYLLLSIYIVRVMLRETKPLLYYLITALLFVLSQLDFFLLSKIICKAADGKVDGSFIATLLETVAIIVIYFGWKSITEESWDEPWNGGY